MWFKLIVIFCFVISIDCTARKSARNGRALDLDAILEGRLSNHIIGERQSRMLNNQDSKNVTSNLSNTTELANANESTSKTAKLIDEEETMQKHASFISHYASDEELSNADKLKKSIDNLGQYMDTLPRVVNNEPLYPQASSVSYLNPSNPAYPNEDKILAALIGQAASNIVSSGQTGDLNAAQSNPPPIYASSADKPLPINNNGANLNQNNQNKKRPFSSIGSSLQEFVSSLFPTKVTNKFINRRKQNGQNNANQIDFASFASECICVPFYMCNRGYIEQNQKQNQQTNSLASTPVAGFSPLASSSSIGANGFDQKKIQNIYDTTGLTPAALELIENTSSLDKMYNTQRLVMQPNQYQDFQQAASSLIQQQQQNAYPMNTNNQFNLPAQQAKENKDNLQSLPTPLPMTISRRTQLTNDDTASLTNQEANKSPSDTLELPIDERSIDGKVDLNQTEAALEASDIEALTRMFNSPTLQSAPATSTASNEQNCGMLRTCCPMLNQRDLLLAQQSLSFLQAQQAQLNAVFQQSPNANQQMFAFENFQPSFIDQSAMLPVLSQPSQAQPSQNNFIYQPVYPSNSQSSMQMMNNQPINNNQLNAKRPILNNAQSLNSQMINNKVINTQMTNPIMNPNLNPNMNTNMNPNLNGNNQMNPTEFNANQFSGKPFNKWIQDDKRVYQNQNLFVQPSLTSYLMTKSPANYQARNNQPKDFFVESSEDDRVVASLRKNQTFNSQQCGRRPNLPINRQLSENYPAGTAKFGNYPWQGALLKSVENTDKSLFICGLTLISDQWALTSSHCLKKDQAKDFKVRLGEYDVYREDEPYQFVERNVIEIIRHPNYDPSTLYNDIALLRFEPIDLATNLHIVPVCRAQFGENFAGQRCWLSGFGKSEFKGSYQSVLREVELPILDHSQCSTLLQQTRLGSSFDLHPGFICAGAEQGRDACTGDGGSALVCDSNGQWKAAGLVSWGIGCGQQNHPGVYVNLGFYENWIDNTIALYESKRNFNMNQKSTENILINPPRDQFDHNTLNTPSNGDLLSESSSLYSSIIKKPQNKKTVDLSSIINERTTNDKTELSISS